MIAACDDFDDMVAWGEHHLEFLRRFSEFPYGVLCARWLRDLKNRIDPTLFARCFETWVASVWPGQHDFTAIPVLLDTLAEAGQLKGALVTIVSMGCRVDVAGKSLEHGGDYLLALKGNQPTLEADAADYFRTVPASELATTTTIENGHGRIETRTYVASGNVDWIASARSYPGRPRCPGIATLVQVLTITETGEHASREVRAYISSARLDIERIAAAVRGHWGVESMHWLLDVEFKDDLSRYR